MSRIFRKVSGYSPHLEYFTIRHSTDRAYRCNRANSKWVVREVEHPWYYLRLLLFDFCATVCMVFACARTIDCPNAVEGLSWPDAR